jgi:aromatic-L-amino-acid decarboxylase
MAKMFGLSPDFLYTSERGGGIILGTASEVAITVAVAARERALTLIESENEEQSNVNTPQLDAKSGQNASSEDAAATWRGLYTSKLVMYGTTQTHSIGAKAATVLGLSFRAIEVHAKDAYSLRGDQLEAALKEDTAKGLIPFMLIATVGTTSSGAVDNLAEIQSVGECKRT